MNSEQIVYVVNYVTDWIYKGEHIQLFSDKNKASFYAMSRLWEECEDPIINKIVGNHSMDQYDSNINYETMLSQYDDWYQLESPYEPYFYVFEKVVQESFHPLTA